MYGKKSILHATMKGMSELCRKIKLGSDHREGDGESSGAREGKGRI